MNPFRASAIAVGISLGFCAGANAQVMSKDQYRSGKDGIAAQYKAEKDACGSLSGNAKDICRAEAGGREKVAKAELDANYKPSENARYKLRVARAEAGYAVARERCDDSAGNVKDVCLKEASAAEVAAKSDAKAKLKSANANNVAREKGTEARKDAASATRDADYAVAKEKCDTFAGEAKVRCLSDAKARFGKS
jgi:hypothetical protein